MGANSQMNAVEASENLERFIDAATNCRDEEAERLSHQLTSADGLRLRDFAHSSANLDLRWWSIRALAVCGDAQIMLSLIELLDDTEPEVRAVTALTLSHIGLRLSASSDSLDSIEDALIHAIGHQLGDSSGSVRQAAADALVLLGKRAVPTLQAVLTDASKNAPESARARAAYALRKIGTRSDAVSETAPVLFQILNDSNYLVHTYAHEALDEMGLLDNVLVTL